MKIKTVLISKTLHGKLKAESEKQGMKFMQFVEKLLEKALQEIVK